MAFDTWCILGITELNQLVTLAKPQLWTIRHDILRKTKRTLARGSAARGRGLRNRADTKEVRSRVTYRYLSTRETLYQKDEGS
jgi:hypothetical protein